MDRVNVSVTPLVKGSCLVMMDGGQRGQPEIAKKSVPVKTAESWPVWLYGNKHITINGKISNMHK